jgi:hypothetical protein
LALAGPGASQKLGAPPPRLPRARSLPLMTPVLRAPVRADPLFSLLPDDLHNVPLQLPPALHFEGANLLGVPSAAMSPHSPSGRHINLCRSYNSLPS